jgi:hypothetical protein
MTLWLRCMALCGLTPRAGWRLLAEQMASPAPLGLDDILAAVRRLADDPTRRVAIVVLFGAPGRGKTTLATHIGRQQECFAEINGSSERRGSELREALSRFVSDGNQAAVRARHRREGAAASSPFAPGGPHPPSSPAAPPCCALLLDEADGLGTIGQATVASFVDDLEDGGKGSAAGWASPASALPRWRALILLTCNVMARLHDSILSRAHVLAEVPRPSEATLVQAALAWMREDQAGAAQ